MIDFITEYLNNLTWQAKWGAIWFGLYALFLLLVIPFDNWIQNWLDKR